jgi:hypothetical protein
MSKKSKKSQKGDTWEWEETPELKEALRKLHTKKPNSDVKSN